MIPARNLCRIFRSFDMFVTPLEKFGTNIPDAHCKVTSSGPQQEIILKKAVVRRIEAGVGITRIMALPVELRDRYWQKE